MGLSSGLVCGRRACRGLLLSVSVMAVFGVWQTGRARAMGATQQARGALSAFHGRLTPDLSTPEAMTYELPNGHMRTVISGRAASLMPSRAGTGSDGLSAFAAPLAVPQESAPETGITACTINEATPTTSSCAGTTIEAGWKEGVKENGVRGLLDFSLPNLGHNAIVLNAELELYEKAATTKTKVAMSAYRVTTPWASGATWDTTNGSTPWGKEGGDFEEAGSAINENVGEAKGKKTWYPTRMVQRWINGASAPRNEGSENLGLLIKDFPESEGLSNVVTFDGPTASTKYPTLTIEWVPRGIGASPGYTLLPVASNASTSEKVDPASGDLIATSSDLTIEAKGFPFDVARTYNSLAPSELGYGRGWTDDNTEHLRVEADGSVEYTDPSGATYEFIKNGNSLATPPELEGEVVMCLPGREITSGGYFCSELPKGVNYAVIYVKTELQDDFSGTEGTLYPVSVETPSAKETANYTTGYKLPTSWTDNAKATIDYEESKTKGYTGVTFPAEGEEVKYAEKENSGKVYKLVEFTSEQGKVTKYVYGTGAQDELLTEIVEPSGAVIKITYNAVDQASSVEQIPAGQTSGPTTTFEYYAAGKAPPRAPCTESQRTTVVTEVEGNYEEPQFAYCSNVLDEVELSAALPSAAPEEEAIEELDEKASEEALGEINIAEEEKGGHGDALGVAPRHGGAVSPDIISGKYPVGAIICERKTNYPHKSSHEPTNASVVVTLECELEGEDGVRTKAPVNGIIIRAQLYYEHHLVSSPYPVDAGTHFEAKATAAVPCKSGTYQGWGGAKWYYPKGYTNTRNGTVYATSYGWSVPVNVKC